MAKTEYLQMDRPVIRVEKNKKGEQLTFILFDKIKSVFS